MTQRIRGPFDADEPSLGVRLLPALTVMGASMLTLVPIIATVGLLPPFGLLMLLGWRLTRGEALPIWSPLLLGLFDDLLSGQPTGSAMLLCLFRETRRRYFQRIVIAVGDERGA